MNTFTVVLIIVIILFCLFVCFKLRYLSTVFFFFKDPIGAIKFPMNCEELDFNSGFAATGFPDH